MSSTSSSSHTPISTGPPSSAPTPPPPMPKDTKSVKGSKQPYVLTPEQEAKKLARAQAKAAAPAEPDVSKRTKEQIAQGRFLKRDWVNVRDRDGKSAKNRVKVGSWNMLAQTLVRRELFPGSDCLKWSDRQQMLISELTSFKTDVLALQEVDRLEHLLPHLPAYSVVQAKGRRKQHGCVVLYRTSMFDKVGEKVVVLDEEEVRPEGEEGKTRRGGSRETRNIGLVVGLKRKEDHGGGGLIVLTTHAFWHPLCAYERARQIGILLRTGLAFRSSHNLPSWPIILTGDFNSQPDEPSYTLLTASPQDPDPLSDGQKQLLVNSAQIHKSLVKVCAAPTDKPEESAGIPEFIPPGSVPPPAPSSAPKDEDAEDDDEGEGEGEGEAPSTASNGAPFMKDTRPPTSADGILSPDELLALYRAGGESGQIRSLYDEAAKMVGADADDGRTFGGRGGFGEGVDGKGMKGGGEPNWTSYTPLWHLTLDYIFLLPPSSTSSSPATPPKITAYLRPHATEELEPGLPRKGVSASDHVCVAGEIKF